MNINPESAHVPLDETSMPETLEAPAETIQTGALVPSKHAQSRLRFNYGLFPVDLRDQAQSIAMQFFEFHDRTREAMAEIGAGLNAIKAELDHGLFGRWMAEEFDLSNRSAQNYMNLARLPLKNESLALYPLTALYPLGSVKISDKTRGEIIEWIEIEKPTSEQIADRVRETKAEAKANKTGGRPAPEEAQPNAAVKNAPAEERSFSKSRSPEVAKLADWLKAKAGNDAYEFVALLTAAEKAVTDGLAAPLAVLLSPDAKPQEPGPTQSSQSPH